MLSKGDSELNLVSSMIYQIHPDNQDGKPVWQSSYLLFQCQLRVLLIRTGNPEDAHISHSPGVMKQEESCMPEFTPTGKQTDLQNCLTHNGEYVNALQDDNKNRKKPQTIA